MQESDDRVVGVARLADTGDRDETASNGGAEDDEE
jgi:hypothetical protein